MEQQLNRLAIAIYAANKEKGFWDKPRNVGELLMLVTSELGEALEAHRKDRFSDYENFEKHIKVPTNGFKHGFEICVKDTFEDEIADAIIRLLDMCGGLGIDIEKSIELKLRYNQTREKLHGKKY